MLSAPTCLPDLNPEIDRWRREGQDPLRLAGLVGDRIGRVGRHRLDRGLLTTLDVLHRRHRGRDGFLDAFLDAVLARRDDRFGGRPYLALPLVELVRADLGIDPELMSALLMADVVRRERRPEHASRLDARTRDTRIRHAARFVAAVDPALDLRWLPGPWFALTVLPASLEYDEYFFIRVLQAHEMVFATLRDELRGATQALRDGDLETGTAHIDRANAVFGRAAMLFGLVTTVRPESFRVFGRFSEPTIRPEAPSLDDITSAWRQLDAGGPPAARFVCAVEKLEIGLRWWRTTHRTLTAGLLETVPGSADAVSAPDLLGCLGQGLIGLGGAEVVPPRRPMAA